MGSWTGLPSWGLKGNHMEMNSGMNSKESNHKKPLVLWNLLGWILCFVSAFQIPDLDISFFSHIRITVPFHLATSLHCSNVNFLCHLTISGYVAKKLGYWTQNQWTTQFVHSLWIWRKKSLYKCSNTYTHAHHSLLLLLKASWWPLGVTLHRCLYLEMQRLENLILWESCSLFL